MLCCGGPDVMSKFENMGDKRDRQALKQTIEENLRKVYQDLLQEEVPDRFKALLAQLRSQSAETSRAGEAETSLADPQPEVEK